MPTPTPHPGEDNPQQHKKQIMTFLINKYNCKGKTFTRNKDLKRLEFVWMSILQNGIQIFRKAYKENPQLE